MASTIDGIWTLHISTIGEACGVLVYAPGQQAADALRSAELLARTHTRVYRDRDRRVWI